MFTLSSDDGLTILGFILAGRISLHKQVLLNECFPIAFCLVWLHVSLSKGFEAFTISSLAKKGLWPSLI